MKMHIKYQKYVVKNSLKMPKIVFKWAEFHNFENSTNCHIITKKKNLLYPNTACVD